MTTKTDIIGLHYGMSRQDYDALPAVGQSVIKEVLRSPQICKWREEHPEESEALTIGKAFHTATIEPDKMPQEFCTWMGARRAGNDWEVFKREIAEKNDWEILRHQDMSMVLQMADAVHAHPDASRIFARGPETEAVAVWKDVKTGLMLKARIDSFCDDEWPTVADLKSTIDASPAAFRGAIHRYGYGEQGSMYCDGVCEARRQTGDTTAFGMPNFVIVAVEKEQPFAVGVYPIGRKTIERGRRRLRRAIDLYAKCVESGEWPGYEMQDLEVSEWALREEGIDND